MSTSSSNPYASPATPVSADPTRDAGVWSDGDFLVLRRKRHNLPDRCVLCNEVAKGRVKISLGKSDKTSFLLNENSSTVVRVGICRFHLSRRRRGIVLFWLSTAATMLTTFGFIEALIALRVPVVSLLGLAFLLVLIAVGALAVYGARLGQIAIEPIRIDKHFVWIKGVCSEYLAQVPEAPRAQSQTDE
jgi:hypothetical protein